MNPIQKQLLVYGAAAMLAMVNEGVVNSSPVTGGITFASGTGFFVTDDGYLISNNHVVKDAVKVCLRTSAGLIDAKVVQVDADNDLALLKAEGKFSPLSIAESGTVKLGGTVATIGFPDIRLQGFAPKFAKGEIASLLGAADDPRYFQISVPVQPGNSGGALVDERGNVIGIVSAKLSARVALAVSGALPENVNYAVKSSLLLSFLKSVPDMANKLKAPVTAYRKFEDVVKSAQDASVLVGVIEINREDNIAQENLGAADFEREFYARYPELRPYETIANWAANQLTANGLRGTKDELMEAFARATREEAWSLSYRIGELKKREEAERAWEDTPTPRPNIASRDYQAWTDAINTSHAKQLAHDSGTVQRYEEAIRQEKAKYVLGGRQMGLGQTAILALATPEEIKAAQVAAQARAIADKERATQGQINAVRYNQELAAKGDGYGLLRMAERYRDGDGVEKDLTKAKEYFNKAIAAGSPTAAEELKELNNAVEK
jgi:hypothetical protein